MRTGRTKAKTAAAAAAGTANFETDMKKCLSLLFSAKEVTFLNERRLSSLLNPASAAASEKFKLMLSD